MTATWNDDAVASLRKHAESDLSCSQISQKIHEDTGQAFSRNAVIGKLHRLGLNKKIVKPKRKPRTAERPQRKSVNGQHIATAIEARRHPTLPTVPGTFPEPNTEAAPSPLNIPFLEQRDGQCKFICSPDRQPVTVCGHPQCCYEVKGLLVQSSYCAAHHRFTHSGFGENRRERRSAA